jgi:hypothetical protein
MVSTLLKETDIQQALLAYWAGDSGGAADEVLWRQRGCELGILERQWSSPLERLVNMKDPASAAGSTPSAVADRRPVLRHLSAALWVGAHVLDHMLGIQEVTNEGILPWSLVMASGISSVVQRIAWNLYPTSVSAP